MKPRAPKQLGFGFMAPRSTICPCGADKPANRIVCMSCWKTAPKEARDNFCGGYETRHAGIRQLIAHAATRAK